jgi:hypothetical protein
MGDAKSQRICSEVDTAHYSFTGVLEPSVESRGDWKPATGKILSYHDQDTFSTYFSLSFVIIIWFYVPSFVDSASLTHELIYKHRLWPPGNLKWNDLVWNPGRIAVNSKETAASVRWLIITIVSNNCCCSVYSIHSSKLWDLWWNPYCQLFLQSLSLLQPYICQTRLHVACWNCFRIRKSWQYSAAVIERLSVLVLLNLWPPPNMKTLMWVTPLATVFDYS